MTIKHDKKQVHCEEFKASNEQIAASLVMYKYNHAEIIDIKLTISM
jgi:hypothetical protein